MYLKFQTWLRGSRCVFLVGKGGKCTQMQGICMQTKQKSKLLINAWLTYYKIRLNPYLFFSNCGKTWFSPFLHKLTLRFSIFFFIFIQFTIIYHPIPFFFFFYFYVRGIEFQSVIFLELIDLSMDKYCAQVVVSMLLDAI